MSTAESEEVRSAKKADFLNAMAMMGTGAAAAGMSLPSMLPPMMTPNNVKYISRPHNMADVPSDINDDPDDQTAESDDAVKSEINLSSLGFTAAIPIDWSKTKLPQKTNLYKHMHYRITNYVNPDCIVQIDDIQFNCHLLVLQCYSVYFNEAAPREVAKLPSKQVSPRAFELIYEWMTYVQGDSYTILRRDNILEVFIAAQFLGIKELEEQCWAFVDCQELFSEDTAYLLYIEAKKYGNTAIMEIMVPRIMKFFLTLVSSKDFLEMKVDEIYVLLSSNYITVHSEVEVFMSAVRWLWHDWAVRKQYVEQVMSCVRFGLIAPWQLVDIRRNPENPEFINVTSHTAVQQMIDNGLAYAIIKYWYGSQTGEYFHWIDLLNLTEPAGRNWSGEEKNYVTYRDFLSDLDAYRKVLVEEQENMTLRKTKSVHKAKRTVPEPLGLTSSPRDVQRPSRRSRGHSAEAQGHDSARGDPGHFPGHRVQTQAHDCPSLSAPPPSFWTAYKPTRIPPPKGLFEPGDGKVKRQTKTNVGTTTAPRPASRKKLSETDAAVIIQRAYRMHRRKVTEGRGREDPAKLAPPPPQPPQHQIPSRPCAPTVFIKPPILSHNKRKDFMRKGSLYFRDRESILVFGGIDPHSRYGEARNTGRNVFRYNSELNEWDLVGELPLPRYHHGIASYKGRVYIAGGADPREEGPHSQHRVVSTTWSLDPLSLSWVKEGDLRTARKNFGMVVYHGKLYAVGGQDCSGNVLASVEVYNTGARAWNYATPLNTGRTGCGVVEYRDAIWVAGGMTADSQPLTASVEKFDIKLQIWMDQPPLRFPRSFGCLLTMNEVLYMIGGAGIMADRDRRASSCNAIDVWSSRDQEWKLHFGMAIARHGHAVAYVGSQILIIGGVTTAYLRALSDVECFCCERKMWIHGVSPLPVALSGHSAVTLPPAAHL